jgi:hypothetical protein
MSDFSASDIDRLLSIDSIWNEFGKPKTPPTSGKGRRKR